MDDGLLGRVDAIIYSTAVKGTAYPPIIYHLPGIVATLALILINLVSRDDLNNYTEYYNSGDEGSEVRLQRHPAPSAHQQRLRHHHCHHPPHMHLALLHGWRGRGVCTSRRVVAAW